MYKVIIEIPGKLWVVVNTQNVKEKCGWCCLALANDCCRSINEGTTNINDYKETSYEKSN